MAELKNQLLQLADNTEIVADTGEIDQIRKYKPTDATTNPSLLFKAAQLEDYKSLVEDAIQYGKSFFGNKQKQLENTMDKLTVNFGCEILKIVPGVVSTELDARLSFETNATVNKAKKLIKLYEKQGINAKKRVLFKIASTWEGLQAMKILQNIGVQCNMTLLFNIWQAATAAEFNAFLISPFVGRITDWYMKKNNWIEFPPIDKDPGILTVREIYNYFKKFGYKTVVMGASFRSKKQVLGLAGADKLTVSPKLLEEMESNTETIERVLSPKTAKFDGLKLEINEKKFRWEMNKDSVALEKLSEGIKKFSADTIKLEMIISKKLWT